MEFLGIGPLELLLILAVGFLVLGPGRMAQAGRTVGRWVRDLRRASRALPEMMEELAPEEPPAPKEPPPPSGTQPWQAAQGGTPDPQETREAGPGGSQKEERQG